MKKCTKCNIGITKINSVYESDLCAWCDSLEREKGGALSVTLFLVLLFLALALYY